MSTVIEVSEEPFEPSSDEGKTPPPRPPPPQLFPDPIPNADEIISELIDNEQGEEEEVPRISTQQNPKLYRLIQMSNEDSFDMDDADPNLFLNRHPDFQQQSREFVQQKSSSFWWDIDDQLNQNDVLIDPFPSTISTTVYTAGISFLLVCIFFFFAKIKEKISYNFLT